MGAKKALIVHNNKFVDKSFHALSATPHDVARLRDLLGRDYVGFRPENIVELENPDLADFRAAVLRFFRDAEPDDYLFFYYAGHGIRSETGRLYLALKRTTIDDFEALALDAGFIREKLEQSPADRKVVVLDCCNAGAFRKDGNFVARDAGYDAGLLTANFDPEGTGTYVLGASQSGASAYETVGEDGQPYSLFTDAFIRGVETGEAAPGRETISLVDIAKYIYGQRNKSGQATRPFIDVGNAVGLLEFARNPGAESTQPVRSTASNVPMDEAISSLPVSPMWVANVAAFSVVACALAWWFWPGDPPEPPIVQDPHVDSDGEETPLALPIRYGLTWTLLNYYEKGQRPDNAGSENVVNGYVIVGSDDMSNAIDGDTDTSLKLRILCIKPAAINEPQDYPFSGDYYRGWSGGILGFTSKVAGTQVKDRAHADGICANQIGEGYRIAEFHDNGVGGHRLGALVKANHLQRVSETDTRFWVSINDKTSNFWSDGIY